MLCSINALGILKYQGKVHIFLLLAADLSSNEFLYWPEFLYWLGSANANHSSRVAAAQENFRNSHENKSLSQLLYHLPWDLCWTLENIMKTQWTKCSIQADTGLSGFQLREFSPFFMSRRASEVPFHQWKMRWIPFCIHKNVQFSLKSVNRVLFEQMARGKTANACL